MNPGDMIPYLVRRAVMVLLCVGIMVGIAFGGLIVYLIRR